MVNRRSALNYLNARQEIVKIGDEFSCLPNIYRVFVSNYELGDETKLFRSLKVKTDSKPEPVTIRWENSKKANPWNIEGDRLLGITTLEDMKYEIEEYDQRIEPWHQSGMIKIGRTHGDAVLLGVESGKEDRIYLYGESSDHGEFFEIASDIFSLFSKIELVPDTELLDFYKVTLSELVLTWGEDFWRVREGKLT
ncbi:MAG: hypothetical protein NXI08_16345 [bacterium]|jgi:hypothetical protein|nr:hypothetical protein [bacterium]